MIEYVEGALVGVVVGSLITGYVMQWLGYTLVEKPLGGAPKADRVPDVEQFDHEGLV